MFQYFSRSNRKPIRQNVSYNRIHISKLLKLQKLAKIRIYLTPCPQVCSEGIFDSRPFRCNKIFLKNLFKKFVDHIFTLLLAPFSSKLVNYSRHSESLNIQKNPKIDDIFPRQHTSPDEVKNFQKLFLVQNSLYVVKMIQKLCFCNNFSSLSDITQPL